MIEYEYLILDIIVAWRIYSKILATILSVLFLINLKILI